MSRDKSTEKKTLVPKSPEEQNPFHGVYQERMTDLDVECEGHLPDELYISMVMNGADDNAKRLAMRAYEAGFDFQSFGWNERGERRDAAVSTLSGLFEKQGLADMAAEANAKEVCLMCDLAAFGAPYYDVSKSEDVRAKWFANVPYAFKMDIVRFKMAESSRHSREGMSDMDWYEDYIRWFREQADFGDTKDDSCYISDDEGFAKATREMLGLPGEYDELFVMCHMEKADFARREPFLLDDRVRSGYKDMRSVACTMDMLADLGEFDGDAIFEATHKTGQAPYANMKADDAAREEKRVLATLWHEYGKDPGFLESPEAKAHGDNLLLALGEYDERIVVSPALSEVKAAAERYREAEGLTLVGGRIYTKERAAAGTQRLMDDIGMGSHKDDPDLDNMPDAASGIGGQQGPSL